LVDDQVLRKLYAYKKAAPSTQSVYSHQGEGKQKRHLKVSLKGTAGGIASSKFGPSTSKVLLRYK